MAELMLVNPRKRRSTRKKPRTAAQRAATRRLVAANKRRSTPKRRTPAKRRAMPARRRRAASSTVHRARRYKRNPSARGIVNSTLLPAATGASGALALDILWGFVPIPETLKAGPLRYVVKGAGALGMGWLAGKVVKKSTAGQLASGALTVIMHDAMRDMMAKFMPGVGLGYYSAGYPVGEMGEYVDGGMGEYVGGDSAGSYLAPDMLTEPFSGQSAAEDAFQRGVAESATTETENNMGGYYNG